MAEDHITLQHTDWKKHTIKPVAAVEGLYHLGKDTGHPGKARLLHPAYFEDRDLRAKAVAQEVTDYIAAVHDPSVLKHVYVHRDAGAWLRKVR